jgi:hypothetical protein
MLLKRDVKDPCASVFFLQFLNVGSFDLQGEIYSDWRSLDIISLLRLCHVNSVDIVLLRFDLVLVRDGLLESHHTLTGLDLSLIDTNLHEGADLNCGEVIFFDPLLDSSLLIFAQL